MPARIEQLEPGLVEALGELAAYPLEPSAANEVTHVQTHLSHVFLTRERVYKLHKAVDLGFVCFATQAERNLDCVRELELNRRLAPDVYLGVAPIEQRAKRWRVGDLIPKPGVLKAGEHCIVMRRLPEGRDALSLLQKQALGREPLERLARSLAAFHRSHELGPPSPYSADEWRRRIVRPVEANFQSLLERTPGVVPSASVLALRERARELAAELSEAFERRREAGRATDGHGDLHLDHVWFESDDAEPVVIDCIAFDDALRQIDSASDMAFLAMDLGSRGHPELAEHTLASYAATSDDFDLYNVLDYFISYRAAVRAKVAALQAIDVEIPESQRAAARDRACKRLDFALEALAPRGAGRVFLVGGIIGAGKTSAARELARRTGAVILSSDVVRRSVGDPSPGADRASRASRYEPEAIGRVYVAMLERAAAVVDSGRDVILDASWSLRTRRDGARRWAEAHGARAVFLEVRCPRDIALERLEKRQRRGTDASEAGPDLYDAFVRAFDPLDEWPADAHIAIDTAEADWQGQLDTPLLRPVRHT